MRTKALLLSAAVLAAGLISSQAQSSNVYSVNVVGYYTINVLPHGYWFLANQATNSGNDINLILTNGVISDPDAAINTTLYKWKGALTPGYDVYNYFTDADAANNFGMGFGDGWYDGAGAKAVVAFNEGTGAFLFNPSNVTLTNTLVGQVVQGTSLSSSVFAGYNALAIKPAISTNLDSLLTGFPGKSDPDASVNDIYYHWKGGALGYDVLTYFTDADAANNFGQGFGNGWYDGAGVNQSTNPVFFPKVGEAFFIFHIGGTSNWVYSFSVK